MLAAATAADALAAFDAFAFHGAAASSAPGARDVGDAGRAAARRPEDEAALRAVDAAGAAGPARWRAQLQAIFEAGAQGTVEDFHRFLVEVMGGVARHGEPRFVVLVASMLSAQTRDGATLAAVRRLASALGDLTPAALAGAELEEVEACLRGVNFHKTKARNLRAIGSVLLAEHGGAVPRDFEGLVALPGVGPKIANLVRALAFADVEDCGMVVDTHVHRLARRLGWTSSADASPEHTRRRLEAFVPAAAREVVTRRLVAFGQEVCLPRGPLCGGCPLSAAGLCPSAPGAARAPDAQAPAAQARAFSVSLRPADARGAKRRIELEVD